jgi:hypothetical protein
MSALRSFPLLTLRDPEYFGVLGTNLPNWARIVRRLTFFFVCLFAGLSFEGCSRRDPQRAKDDADRQAIVGVWDWIPRNPDITSIMRISYDGAYSTSNKIVNNPSHHIRVAEGKWNITNGEIVMTDIMVSWDGHKDPQADSVFHERIVRITDQELSLEFEVAGVYETNFYVTNDFRRAK